MPKPLPTEALAALFGSRENLAAAAGVHRSMINKWEGRETKIRKRGHIPSRYNLPIIAAARRAGIEHDFVVGHLDMHSCPLCGSALTDGAQIDARILRRLGNGAR